MRGDLRLVLKGGLGNQLLQYFAGLELSKFYGRELLLDISWFERKIHENGFLDKRLYLLNQYEFAQNLRITKELNWRNSPRIERISRNLPKSINNYVGVYEELFAGDFRPLSRKEVTVFGHWIMKPMLPSREILRKQLVEGLENPSPRYKTLVDNLHKRNVISIHHRLGDYKNFGHRYGVINESYFFKAVEKIEEVSKLKEYELWLFSDEPELSSRLLSSKLKITKCFSNENEINEAETIALMSQSTGIICSNSTFSWWSALLSDEIVSTVVFPKYYMTDILTYDTGLYVNSWNYL